MNATGAYLDTAPRLMLADFARPVAAAPLPASVNNLTDPRVISLWRKDFLNRRYGTCVAADTLKTIAAIEVLGGRDCPPFGDAHAATLHKRWSGTDPTAGKGVGISTAFNDWCNSFRPSAELPGQPYLEGMAPYDAAGWVGIDAGLHPELVARAICDFGFVSCHALLPTPLLNVKADSFVWESTSQPPEVKNGHLFPLYYYDAVNFAGNTWGWFGLIKPAWLQYYCCPTRGGGLCTVVISQNVINRASQRAPNGYDWAALVKEANDVFGAGLEWPAPPPPPTPTPGTLVNQDNALMVNGKWVRVVNGLMYWQ